MSQRLSFDTILVGAIDEGLVKALGGDAARAVRFYVDPAVAVVDPDRYVLLLERMFLDKEICNSLTDAILERLCDFAGVQKMRSSSFGECVGMVREEYLTSRREEAEE